MATDWKFSDAGDTGCVLEVRVDPGPGQIRIETSVGLVCFIFDPPRQEIRFNGEMAYLWCAGLMAAADRIRPSFMEDIDDASDDLMRSIGEGLDRDVKVGYSNEGGIWMAFNLFRSHWELEPLAAAYLGTFLGRMAEQIDPGVTKRMQEEWDRKDQTHHPESYN